MRKKLFYLCYVPAVLAAGILYYFLYRTGISNQTGFYVGESSLLTLFYLLGIFLLVGLYIWAARSAAKSEGASAEGNSFLWGASSVLCGILLLMGGLYGGWQTVSPLFSREAVQIPKLFLPGLDCFLSLAAALSFMMLGSSAVASEPAHLPVFPQPALDLPLECFSAGHQVWSAANGFPDAARLLEILMMTAQCLFLLAGSHLICNVIGQKKLPMGAVFWTCGDRAGIDLVCLPVDGGKFGAVRFITDAELLDGVGACFIHRPFLLFYYAGRPKNEAGSIAHQRPDCRQAFINKE